MSSNTTVTVESDPQQVPEPRRPPRRLRKFVLVSSIVLAVVAGFGTVSGVYYYDSVALPQSLSLPANTVLYYSDGSVLAKLGQVHRTPLKADQITDEVKQVAVAAKDPDFYHNTGGPIARSVARTNYEMHATTFSGRLRIAVAARKLDGAVAKDQILEDFLNNTPFGRQTFGIEAAAQEYFGKTADKRAPQEKRLTRSEAIVLLALVDQPESAGESAPGFDPTNGRQAEQNSRQRFEEIRASLRDEEFLTEEQANALTFPTNVKPYDKDAWPEMFSRPVSLVVNQVLSELTLGDTPWHGKTWDSIRDGGYQIQTTISRPAQKALEDSADARLAGSVMSGQPETLQAAGVMVEPGTGRVLAYYGGANGAGMDYAGVYTNEAGKLEGVGMHPPGSSFMVYTLAAALQAGYSLNSYWEWRPHDLPGRTGAQQIRNASVCPRDRAGACSLLDSITASLNVPMYAVTASVTPAKVLEVARAAGIDSMWTDTRVHKNLAAETNVRNLVPSQFDLTLGLGQYPVTVLDQANAMATFAAGGHRARAHFVAKVQLDDKMVYDEKLAPDGPTVVSPSALADLTSALSNTMAAKLTVGDSARKTGTWEFNGTASENAHAWMIGYTSRLALAVWVGDKTTESAIKNANGETIWGSGLPSTIFRNVLDTAHTSMSLKPAPFPPPANAGNPLPPGSVPQ